MPSSRMNIVPADHAQGVSTLAASKARGPVRACGRRGRHGSPCHRVRGDGCAAYAALRARCAAARRHTAVCRARRGGAAEAPRPTSRAPRQAGDMPQTTRAPTRHTSVAPREPERGARPAHRPHRSRPSAALAALQG